MTAKKILLFFLGFIVGVICIQTPLGQEYISKYRTYIPFFSSSTGHIYQQSAEDKQAMEDSIKTMQTIFATLQDSYFDKDALSATGMREGSIHGFVAAVQDPYTEYFSVEQNTDFVESLKGEEEFEGIGAAVAKKENGIQVQEVFKGTPAAVAGIVPLDVILEINGEKTQDMTLTQAVQKIRGPKNTPVTLLLYRASVKDVQKSVFSLDVIRNAVQIPSVSSEIVTLGTHTIGYISIALIGEETDALLQKEIDALQAAHVEGIVLDLRGNGGGYLPKSVDIVSHFMAANKRVVTAKYSKHPTETYDSRGVPVFDTLPLVILVDGITASAGEIIAGALQQQRGAILVGTKTFGKGSIQTMAPIGSGTALKYTIGKWYLPDDTNIDHTGITPDVEVAFDKDAYMTHGVDNQKEKAFQLIQEKIQ